MSLQQLIKDVGFPDIELATDDSTVVYSKNSIHVLHTLCPHVCEFLDLSSRILDLRVK